ncbi:MAG TPA: hypothetical protein VKH41_12145 [Myxococcota bacterium]|nr:hypothetical protein [Myxococcota bacterium]
MRFVRFGIALAIVACATAPPQPVVVSDDDLSAARAIAESLSPVSGDYRVSEIDVWGRAVTLELVAESHGKGWQRTDRAQCRRCTDAADWSCASFPASVQVQVRGGSWASASGLDVAEAQNALRFLSRKSSDPALRSIRPQAIGDLAAISDGRICVRYGPISAYEYLVLKRRGRGFEVDGSPADCAGVYDFESRPVSPVCE